MIDMHHPFLTGNTIYLRGLEEKDIEGPWFQWFNDAEVCKYNSHAVFPNSVAAMKDFLARTKASKEEVVFAICDKKTDKHVGNVAWQKIDPLARSAEFAIVIGDREAWGKGVGAEAGKLMVEYAVSKLNLRRLHCGTHAENKAMRKLALKMGMREEGVRKEAGFKDGRYHDIVLFGMVRDGA